MNVFEGNGLFNQIFTTIAQNFSKISENVNSSLSNLINKKSNSLPNDRPVETKNQSNSKLAVLYEKISLPLNFIPAVIIVKCLYHACCSLKAKIEQGQKKEEPPEAPSAQEKTTTSCPNKTPQLIVMENGSVTVIKPAPPITFLVLEGGGAKGIAYPTYLMTLEAQGPFLHQIRDVAGSSAGSLMAFLISSGVSLDQINNYVNKSNMFEQINGKLDDIKEGYGFFSAGNLVNGLKEMACKEANAYCKSQDWDSLEKRLLESGVNPEKITKFKQNIDNNFKEGVTFSDLELLSRLAPTKFKQLHVTGYIKKTEKILYFNSKDYPDMPCHKAVRISMAIPKAIKEIIMDDGQKASDGGQGDNLPITAKARAEGAWKEGTIENPAQTLALVFDKGGEATRILHNPAQPDSKNLFAEIQKKIARLIALFTNRKFKEHKNALSDSKWHGNEPPLFRKIFLGQNYVENQKKSKQEIYDLGPNIGVVPHGDLGTLSVIASAKRVEKAKQSAKAAALEFAKNRENQAIYAIYDTMEDALASLTAEEKEAYLAEQATIAGEKGTEPEQNAR